MMMLQAQGTKLSDSPVVDGRQKEVFLPPLNTHRKCSGSNECDSEEDSDGGTRASQFLSTRWRAKTKHKKVQNRLEANQSSMSDSFVLPRIHGSQSGNADHHDRKSRASLSLPKRTRDTCIPLSKSCPALVSNQRGRSRRTSGGETPDYDYEYDDDFEEYDNSRDFKSVSCNADSLHGRKRDERRGDNTSLHEDITEGVVCKLAKLESPRGKASHNASFQHQEPGRRPPKPKESCTALPDIFVPNGLSVKAARDQHQAKRESQVHPRNAKVKSVERTIQPESRIPEVDPTDKAKDNSYGLNCSPWKASDTVDTGGADAAPAAPDPADRQSRLSQATQASKKKRTQKRQRSLEKERPHLLRDTSHADIKCIDWLSERHNAASQLTSSELPDVT